MSVEEPGSFQGLVGIHEGLIRTPEADATGDALYPGRLHPSQRWMPTFEPMQAYQAVDPVELGLGGHESFHDVLDADLDRAILRVIDTEGPVHFQVLADRLLTAAGVSRLGSRIRERIVSHLDALEATGSLERRDDFAARWQQYLVPRFRDWTDAPEKTRELDHVHDSELMLCLFRAVLDQEGADVDTVMNDGIYAIGFIRLTQAARQRRRPPLETLIDMAMLSERDGQLVLGREAMLRQRVQCPA